ncbi:MAG: transglutaminase domain-containing protein, partial [Lachnospiraceae bacterium]|nr:transglutaminase domain-containing protein [Lachnospiraceae bacterium]
MLFISVYLAFSIIAVEVQLRSKKEGDRDSRKHMVFICIFIIAASLIVAVVPAPNKPIDWSPVIRAYRFLEDKIYDTLRELQGEGSSDPDSFYFGFGDGNNVNGSPRSYSKSIMDIKYTVYTSREYLNGRVFDHFDGKNWSCDGVRANDLNMDSVITMVALLKNSPEYSSDYYKMSRADITFLTDDYDRLFVSPKTMIRLLRPAELLATDDKGMVKGENLKKNQSYNYDFMIVNRYNDAVLKLIENAEYPTKNEWDRILTEEGRSTLGIQSYESFLEYEDYVKKAYLENEKIKVSDRMQAFLDELLAGADTPFEKASRIESLLSSYEYNLSPGDMPEDVKTPSDFLDYFVFNKRKGYCVHYATAFVLMARAAGLPARYVQGYMANVKRGEATVKSEDAHAWPEVYFDGIGWLNFEPTPGKKLYIKWDTEAEKADAPVAYGVNVPLLPNMENMPERYGDFNELSEFYEDEETESIKRFDYSLVWLVIIAFFAFIILLIALDSFIKRVRYVSLTNEEKLKDNFRRLLKGLKYFGEDIEKGETLREYRNRIFADSESEKKLALKKDIIKVMDKYERVIYSGETVSLADVKEMRNCIFGLLEVLKKEKRAGYLYYY